MPVELLQLAGALAVVVIGVLAAVIRSYKGGYLGNVVQRHMREDELNGTLGDIQTTVEETHDDVQDIGEAIYMLHRDDENVDEAQLREKVGVDDLAGDIFDRDDAE